MVINRNHGQNTNRIEFISYTGKWPNLCRGILTVKIDGEIVKFGHDSSSGLSLTWDEHGNCSDGNYSSFWISGGSVSHDGNYNNWDVKNDEWKIDVDSLNPKFWDLADELDEVINKNIPWGCCGGCI